MEHVTMRFFRIKDYGTVELAQSAIAAWINGPDWHGDDFEIIPIRNRKSHVYLIRVDTITRTITRTNGGI